MGDPRGATGELDLAEGSEGVGAPGVVAPRRLAEREGVAEGRLGPVEVTELAVDGAEVAEGERDVGVRGR